jgi:hypothetical protein
VISLGERGILRNQIYSEFLSGQWCEDNAAEEGAMPSMANKGKADSKPETGANLGFEAKLWQMADGLRNNMDAAEYKHVVLG